MIGQYNEKSLDGIATFTDLEGNEKKGEWRKNKFIKWLD